MPKPIDAGLLTELSNKRGTEPTNIVTIQWDPTNVAQPIDYYETNVVGGDPTKKSSLLTLSGIESIRKVTGGGGVGSVSVTLDDPEGELEQIVIANDIHKRSVKIYQTFKGYVPPGGQSERALIFDGEVSSPIVYNEESRTLSFDALTVIESEEVGFSPEESDDFDFIAESALGKAWPLCFGSPIRVPAVKITESVRGTSLTRYGAITLGDLNDLCAKAATFGDAESNKILQEQNLAFNNDVDDARLTSFGSAKVALDTTLASLVFDVPTQEQNLISYADTCTEIRKNERNRDLFVVVSNDALAQIDILQPQVDSLNVQIAQALGTEPVDANLVTNLQTQLDIALNGVPEDPQAGTQATLGLNDYQNRNDAAIVNIGVANSNLASLNATKSNLERQLLRITLTELIIQGGEKFPQGVALDIIINGARFKGTFSGETFSVIDANLPLHTNVLIQPGLISNQFIIPDASLSLKGQFCYLGDAILYVEDQLGTTCTFTPTLFEKVGEFEFGTLGRDLFDFKAMTGTIKETSALFFLRWRDALQLQVDGVDRPQSDVSNAPLGSSRFSFANGLDNLRSTDYNIEVGDTVYLADGFEEAYVANLIPSTDIHEVMAFRLVEGVRRLVPVPSRYYNINLSESIAGQTSTTLRFPTPLIQYLDENWEDDIYVSLTSSEGPNTADVIEYIVNTYTDLTPESASFAAVASDLTPFPSHFAVLERRDALDLIDDISYQARCATFIRNDELVLVYLAKEPSVVRTLDASNVAIDSVEVTFTPTEDLVTKMTASWRRDYAKEDEDRGKLNQIVLRNNIPLYGNHEEEREFFIYNIEELVERSLTFWIIRKSNTWYQVTLTGHMDQLELEPYDGVVLDFDTDDYPILINPAVVVPPDTAPKDQVLDISYNSETKEIGFLIWRPIPASRDITHRLAYPGSAASGIEYPTNFDPYTGGAAAI